MNALDAQPALVRNLLQQFAARLRARFGSSLVQMRLFGSWARGSATEDSDVDVLVVLDRVDWRAWRAVIDLGTDVGLDVDVRISPTVLDRATWDEWQRQQRPLLEDIERDGVPL